MEMKTKKSLALNALGLAAGLAGFAAGIAYSLPVIGLAGFVGIVYGGTGVVDETIKGIAETVKFNKEWREREKGIRNKKSLEGSKQQGATEEKVEAVEEKPQEPRLIEKAIERNDSSKGDSDEGMSI